MRCRKARVNTGETIQTILSGSKRAMLNGVKTVLDQKVKAVLHAQVARVGRHCLAKPLLTEKCDKVFDAHDLTHVRYEVDKEESRDRVFARPI